MGGMARPLRVALRILARSGSLRVGETSRTNELYAVVASIEEEEEEEADNPPKVVP
jgi:hypothetical protein